jgi:tRNA(Ile)-lysidine synthase
VKILINHVEKFIQRATLLGPSKKVVVAVSAGSDSMALLFVMKEILNKKGINNLRAFHINHGTRSENKAEQELVEQVCSQGEIPLVTFKLALNPKEANFEFIARSKRYELFSQNLQKDEVLFTAHHLDDSFEWSLLRQLKSGNQKAYLGIPVKNGPVRRPFLCLTKTQIKRFVTLNKISFMDDPSNKQLRFERNYLRERAIPSLTKRFPNYLKHYAFRSNELALSMNLSVFGTSKDFKIKKDKFNGFMLTSAKGNDFTGAEESIRKIIYKLSNKKRGVLSTQIEKLILAAKANKKGPLIFSGGVHCFIGQNQLYFISRLNLNSFQEMDKGFMARLKNKEFSYHPKKFLDLKNSQENFLDMVIAEKMPGNFPSIKNPHPLLPRASDFAIKSGLWINTLSKLLFHFERSSEIEKKTNFDLFIWQSREA